MSSLLGPELKTTARGVLRNVAYAEYLSNRYDPKRDILRDSGRLLRIRRSIDNAIFSVVESQR